MKRSLALMIEFHEDGHSPQAIDALQVEALRHMAHLHSTQPLTKRGATTLPSGVRLRWTFKETETRQ